jgi:hypothetical protein
MIARKMIAPELMVECRRLYEETLTPAHEIWARMGLSRDAFYVRVREEGWQRRRYSSSGMADVPAVSALAVPADEPAPAPVSEERRAVLRARAFRAAEIQMDTIERILRTLQPGNAAQSERSARVIASLNGSLREITAITTPEPTTASDAADPDAVPRDIDELRLEIERRIHAYVWQNGDMHRTDDEIFDPALDQSGL